ncbi:hypothetical protein LTR99_010077 [Exophiala xenobiotica]|uniref:Uncharacterized protein n=1 Tax=Vermiconidia calcicola TaxID=1690605 RepID=A0AAV9PYR5_9PEZI|nr:hypothetical protein LTR92_002031 [Exophiala xenobiotica]KAK5529513.1 hypothetical protein LTR25_009761 [Vermiconidia calcicola]KAK5532629.1 hypothetical protein LTR23_009520 [Chaetothyriales sp. CCFEE 6169]KAK5269239.1 hypothetical protein LTR96_006024 [Exophiala xenobiotica]KAK5293152.1 hypothetical protein LTR99_010077 [Exophiala xenobiotica]
MGLRVKLRKTFSSKPKTPNSTAHTPQPGEIHYTDRTDIEYYKPHEIPRSKYRGKVDPEHQASLAAFSLADAFSAARRRSSLALSGTFSPGGTKAQSRATSRAQSRIQSRATSRAQSRIQSRTTSRAPSRVQSRAPSRRPSQHEHLLNSHHAAVLSGLRMESHANSSSSGSTSREKSLSASTALDVETASTSISEYSTAVASAPAERNINTTRSKKFLTQHDSGIGMNSSVPDIVLSKQITAHDTPFTAEELEQAMTRAMLKPRYSSSSGGLQMPSMGRRSAISSS